MLQNALIGGILVVGTVVLQALGLDVLFRVMMRSRALDRSGFRPVISMVVGLSCWLVLVHLTEISLWGLSYLWLGCLPDAESALYFSAITYTTVGYGDLVLAKPWRMLAACEALTGILMCGLSAGLFFAVVSRWIGNWMQREAASGFQAAAPSQAIP